MIGHDLTRPEFANRDGRAIMQYNGAQAYMPGDQVVILREDLDAEQFTYDGHALVPLPTLDAALARTALAHAN